MITLPELLEDPVYRKFFMTVPKTLKPAPGKMPWRVLIQREADGPWAKKEFARYADAFRLIADYRKRGKLHDGTIQSRGIAFAPPQRVAKVSKGGKPVYYRKDGRLVRDKEGNPIRVTTLVDWKPRLDPAEEAHEWCTYCRRPTVFRWFRSHHAVRASGLAGLVDPADRRCTICGAREGFILSTRKSARLESFDPAAVRKAGRRARR